MNMNAMISNRERVIDEENRRLEERERMIEAGQYEDTREEGGEDMPEDPSED